MKFLSDANLGTASSRKFVWADNLDLDPDLYSKLVTLSGDSVGKDILIKLFDSGYLTAEMDIPDLIRRGLTQEKIDEKSDSLTELEEILKNPDVR